MHGKSVPLIRQMGTTDCGIACLTMLFQYYVVKSVEGKRTTEIQNAISRLVKGKTILIIVTNVYTKRKNTNA